jgi:hypothetical protein
MNENVNTLHSAACWAMPECAVCGLRKKPWGRDAGVAVASGFCDGDCPGYEKKPRPGHFWPDEEPELKAAAERIEK